MTDPEALLEKVTREAKNCRDIGHCLGMCIERVSRVAGLLGELKQQAKGYHMIFGNGDEIQRRATELILFEARQERDRLLRELEKESGGSK